MSLVSTYVRADDGNLYRDPVLSGNGWFICFDDDDPVELVVTQKSGIKDSQEFLKSLGINPLDLHKGSSNMRQFEKGKWESAKSWFFEIDQTINHKLITRHNGIVERNQISQGVIYDPKEDK